jgi:uncharacterized membrane protein
MQNIITAIFQNESEGYQMITELSHAPVTEQAAILQMALVKCDEKGLQLCDRYEGIATSGVGPLIGGLTGGLIGILGGPLGILFMGTAGALTGSMVDGGEAVVGEALMETVANKLYKGEVGLIILADEEDESYIDGILSKVPVEILRYDALDIADEVDRAVEIQNEMDRQARLQLRQSKKEAAEKEWQEKRDARQAELEANFEEYKKTYNL